LRFGLPNLKIWIPKPTQSKDLDSSIGFLKSRIIYDQLLNSRFLIFKKMHEMPEDIKKVLDEADLLCDGREVTEAIHQMARKINQRLENKQIFCLSVMLGGLIPTGQ